MAGGSEISIDESMDHHASSPSRREMMCVVLEMAEVARFGGKDDVSG